MPRKPGFKGYSTEELAWLLRWAESHKSGEHGATAALVVAHNTAFPEATRCADTLRAKVQRFRRPKEWACTECGELFHLEMLTKMGRRSWCPACLNADDPEALALQLEQLVTGTNGHHLGRHVAPSRRRGEMPTYQEMQEGIAKAGVPSRDIKDRMTAEFAAAKAHREDGHPWPRRSA